MRVTSNRTRRGGCEQQNVSAGASNKSRIEAWVHASNRTAARIFERGISRLRSVLLRVLSTGPEAGTLTPAPA